MMRVLHVCQPVEAGVPAVVADLVTDQVRRGHVVHVACSPTSVLAARAAAAGAQVHAWQATRDPGPQVLAEVRALRRIVTAADPDVVVLHSAKAGLAGRLALRGSRPVVVAPHAWSFQAATGPVATAATAWEVVAGRWTDLVVSVGHEESTRGRAAGITAPAVVVDNGVDLGRVDHRTAAAARADLGLPAGPAVLCVGRLTRQKGQDMLLDAWSAILDQVPGATLVLVGDGPDRADLAARAGAGVVFLGARDDVPALLAAADVVVLPSRWEGAALVPLEAMAAARPVVGFDVGGLAEVVGDGGTVLPPLDVAGLARAVVGYLTDPYTAMLAGKNGRVRVEQGFDLQECLAGWEDALQTAATGAGRPLQVVAVERLGRTLVGGLRGIDVAVVTDSSLRGRFRASALSAFGVPVHQPGPGGAGPALGAPVLDGPADDAALGRLARRPGTSRTTHAPDRGPAVSVVVTVLDEGPALRRLVDQALAQLTAPGDELVVVDGGSTDGSLGDLPQSPVLKVQVVPGAGISAGRNHGIRIAANEIIICTDAGCDLSVDFVGAFRRAFTGADVPLLVSGTYDVVGGGALGRAQGLACYPQPHEVAHPSMLLRAYTALFGTAYDPRFSVGRCMAFTKDAWTRVGGFPEHLPTGEDVSFGLAVAEIGRVEAAADARVAWVQRDGLAATWRMYRSYGRASTDGGHRALLVRDLVRGGAYLAAPALLATPATRRLLAAGAAAYLSVPVLRGLRAGAPATTLAALPVALATKDLGKLAGAVQGLLRARRSSG